MRVKHFTLAVTILVVLLATIAGVASARMSAATVCSPATAVSVPFSKDGAGDFCYQATSLCSFINSWNLTTLEVNGTAYTNLWVAGSSIAPLNGSYTIHYVSTVAWGHFEIGAPCSGGNPTVTPTRTITPTPVSTACDTPGACTPTATRTPTRTLTPFILTLTRTPTPTFTPGGGSLPDLVITNVVPAPQGWTGGCATNLNMGVNVTIRNNGTANAGAFVVDVSGAQQTVSGLAVGASMTIWFAKTGSVVATVDATNMVTESNEGNNTFSCNCPPPTPPLICTVTPTPTRTITPTPQTGALPDLIVESIRTTKTCTSPLTTVVTVRNTGTADAGTFVVRLSYNSNGTNEDQTVTSLAAGQSRSVNFNSSASNMSAVADSTNLVTELREDNNSLNIIFTATPTNVPCLPTFTPTRTATRTNTPTGPTLTPTRTATRTNTPPGPTLTPTRTATSSATPVTTGCGSLAICDGFESQTIGGAPSGSWQVIFPNCQGTGTVVVDSAQAHTGTKSIKVDGKAGYCNHAFFGNTTNVAGIGPVVYGRVFIRVTTALQDGHVAFMAMKDVNDGSKDLRFGGQNQVMTWNRESDDATVPSMSPVGVSTSTGLPVNQWSCLEFKVDGTNGFLQAWLNGTEVMGLAVDGTSTADIDAQWKTRTNWHPSLSDVKLGWESYASGDNVLWFDDVAFGASRVGCGS